MDQISTPKISEILKEEFMIPFNLSAYALAKAIHVPVSRIQDILNDHQKATKARHSGERLKLIRLFLLRISTIAKPTAA